MEQEETWAKVDEYFSARLAEPDAESEAVLNANASAGLPPYDVTLLQAKFLYMLARIHRAERILEIGTLGGFSTIWLARALPPGGSVVTLEVNAAHAETAKANFERAGVSSRITIRPGKADESLAELHDEGAAPFDFVFIDADKARNAVYFEWALRLTSSGAVIIIDNAVRNGAVLDEFSDDEDTQGVRAAVEAIRREPSVVATALQTVGSKGYDGFIMAIVDRDQQAT